MNDPIRASTLLCEECGARTITDGPLSAWSAGGATFVCGCPERLTAVDALDQTGRVEADGATDAAPTSWPDP